MLIETAWICHIHKCKNEGTAVSPSSLSAGIVISEVGMLTCLEIALCPSTKQRTALAALLLILLSGCGSLGQHQVQTGETLYAISFRYGWDYRDVAEWNGLSPPYTVYEGQYLRVVPPIGGEVRHTVTEVAPPPRAPAMVSTPIAVPPAKVTRVEPPSPETAPASAPMQWRWPTEGKLVRDYSDDDAGRKGIDIAGKLGQPVRATANGRVVYAGNGLLNYGNLIIVKHNETFLSAYAHNRQMRVKEGEDVVAGQQIADMGARNTGEPLLHFQIRYDGKPINPLRYLPSLQR